MNIIKLAKKLKLSPTTVSRALGGYTDVSEVTRQRVKNFAIKYNYNPNPHASNLASNKSNAVGFVIPLYGLNNNTLNQISYFKFVAGMSSKINQDNILFYMLFANSAKEEMESYKKLIEINKVKNIIIHNVQTNDERIDYLNKNKINFVAWGRSKKINLSKYMSPLKLFDYLAAGRIIFASDLKVYDHVLKNKYNCIKFSLINLNSCANNIKKVLNNYESH